MAFQGRAKSDKTAATMEDPRTSGLSRQARFGLVLFVVYVLLYAAFVYLSAFRLDIMKHEIAGVTLAVLYGFGLIVAAFVLALLYMLICRSCGDDNNSAGGGK
jgi:uncharacterized membrane protein (DUF485 family)